MGGKLEKMGLGGLAATNDRALCLGREAGNSGIFLFRPVSFKIGVVAEITAALTDALVLLLFGGVPLFCCFFLLRRVIGILSLESSVGIQSMGLDGWGLLGDGFSAWAFLLLIVYFQQFLGGYLQFAGEFGVFVLFVGKYLLLAGGFPEVCALKYPLFAEEFPPTAKVCPQLGEGFPTLDEEFLALAREFLPLGEEFPLLAEGFIPFAGGD